MTTHTRTKFEREHDLARTATMYLQRYKQADIARELKVTQQQVAYDLKVIQKRWRESGILNMHEAKMKELAEIDQIETLAYEAYRRSIGQKITTRTFRKEEDRPKPGEPPTEARGDVLVIREELIGDPRYLTVIQTCVDRRIKLLGLDEPIKVDWRKTLEEKGYNPGDAFEELVNHLVERVKSRRTGEGAG